MVAIVEEGLRAGALGFSTSRTILHRSIDGELVPGTTATKEELIGIGRAMGRVGYGVFELVSDLRREWNEFEWMGELSRETGLPITFAALQSIAKELIARRADRRDGARERQGRQDRRADRAPRKRRRHGVARHRASVHVEARVDRDRRRCRGTQQLAQLRDPSFRARMHRRGIGLSRSPTSSSFLQDRRRRLVHAVRDGPRLQLRADRRTKRSWRSRAAKGVSGAELAYDLLMEDDGRGFIYFPILNYADGNLDFLEALQAREDCVNSLSDGGAHCGTICDAASPTFMLRALGARPRSAARSRSSSRSSGSAATPPCSTAWHDRGAARARLSRRRERHRHGEAEAREAVARVRSARRRTPAACRSADGYVATIKSGRVTRSARARCGGPTPGAVLRGPRRRWAGPPTGSAPGSDLRRKKRLSGATFRSNRRGGCRRG
mgnify:CR=1 FL=1